MEKNSKNKSEKNDDRIWVKNYAKKNTLTFLFLI